MTPDQYRKIALSFPGASESSHMDHPDFRVGGKIFATLWKEGGVAILTLDQQAALVKSKPTIFAPAKGGWGRRGSTTVNLKSADESSVRRALSLAWGNKAPKAHDSRPKKTAVSSSRAKSERT